MKHSIHVPIHNLLVASSLLLPVLVIAQTNSPGDLRPELMHVGRGNYSNQLGRTLRYTPVGTDFVITNGAEFFNRPLYGPNISFRVDAGDKPEFSLYLPGRGGNLRLGLKTEAGVKWLNDADKIIARYRPGSMVYEIQDELLGPAGLQLTALPFAEGRGLVVRADLDANTAAELVWAFGGVNGMKGRRGGDIGCEREPVSQFFQMKPDQCRDNKITANSNSFTLVAKSATIRGVASVGTDFTVGDANDWADAAALERRTPVRLDGSGKLADSEIGAPIVVGRAALSSGQPVFLALQHGDANDFSASDLPQLFAAAEKHRRTVAERVVVETPDAFINAAAAALNVASDAVWDEPQQSFMHGAVAWRSRLLGWRGQYAGDALGWHERTAAHFAGYARNQNTNPIPEIIPPADEDSNLARNETALHSNGDLMNRSHYDMNLVAVDAFFRHLLWTGDTNFARAMWSVIQRHLAWEKRLFRREFGDDKLPLYEAYAAIWVSDDVQYSGGGSAHGSAYNYWHNKMAARVAEILGEDGMSYEREAELIRRGMEKYLWLPREGTFAEFKDLLGLQLTHDSPALWTFYHTMDSEVPTPMEAWQMSRWVDENIAHIPVQISSSSRREEAQTNEIEVRNQKAEPSQSLLMSAATGEGLFTLPTSNWMPYSWSINNVVVAEMAHTSLAFWQANRPDEAFRLFKGFMLDSMFLGLCPGNVGMTTHYDMARGEAQRDFADGCGATSRALVEGLFGIRPDALAGELKIVPGFPSAWTTAAIRHPDLNFSFRRDAQTETIVVESKFSKPMSLRLQVPALRAEIAIATVNGLPAKFNWLTNSPGGPRVEILADVAPRWEVAIEWNGETSALIEARASHPRSYEGEAFDWNKKLLNIAGFETVPLVTSFNDKVTQIFRNEYRSPRSPFCSLAMPEQGIGGWCEPNEKFDVDDSGLRATAASNGGLLLLPNGVSFATPTNAEAKNILFTSQWDNYPDETTVPLKGRAKHAFLLMAGSSNPMQSRMDNGEIIVTYADDTTERLALHNPSNWWPIDQDYFIDDYAFRRPGPIPPRVDLKTGKVRILEVNDFKGKGGKVPGGAATGLDLPLNPKKELKSLTVRALVNEVIVGLMAVTLER